MFLYIGLGEIEAGEETAQSLKCDDCQRLFRDGELIKKLIRI